MTAGKKQVVFTNEIIYERNISDRIWPQFLEAQHNENIQDAAMAVKCYYLFTQQWYQKDSKIIKERIYAVKISSGKPQTTGDLHRQQKRVADAWVELEDIWCTISNHLENYGLFKRNFTQEDNHFAVPTR